MPFCNSPGLLLRTFVSNIWELKGECGTEGRGEPELRSLGTPDRLAPQDPRAQFPCTFIWHWLADWYAGQSRQLASWPGAPSGWHLGHLDRLPTHLPQACSWQRGADGLAGRAVGSQVSCQLALQRRVPWHVWTGIGGQEGWYAGFLWMGSWHRQQRGGFLDPLLTAPLNVQGPRPMVAAARTHLPSSRRVCGNELPLPHSVLSVLIFTSSGLPGMCRIVAFWLLTFSPAREGVSPKPRQLLSTSLGDWPPVLVQFGYFGGSTSADARVPTLRGPGSPRNAMWKPRCRFQFRHTPHVYYENLDMHLSFSGSWFSHHFFLISHSKVKRLE